MSRIIRPAVLTVADNGTPLVVGMGDARATWSQDEFDTLAADIDRVVNFMANEPLLVADTAAKRLLDSIVSAETSISDGSDMGQGLVDVLINLYAFLTASRAFVDQSDRELKHQFGESSPERLASKAAVSAIYDSSASYRFLYDLRNYAQHRAVPLSRQLSASARLVDDGTASEQIVSRLDICCDRDALLTDKDLKAPVRSWLKVQPAFFPIAPIVSSGMDSLRSAAIALYTLGACSILEAHERLTPFWEAFEQAPPPLRGPVTGQPGYMMVDVDPSAATDLEFHEVPYGRYTQMLDAARRLLDEEQPGKLLFVCYPLRGPRMSFTRA